MSLHYPKEATWLENHFRTRESRVKTVSHAARWGQTGRLADLEAAVRYSMEGHSYGTTHSLGVDHPATMDVLYQLGDTLERRGRLPEAEAVLRRTLEGRLAHSGSSHGMVDRTRRELARVLKRQGHAEEAAEIMAQVEHPGVCQRRAFHANGVRGGPEQPPVPEPPWEPPTTDPPAFGLREHAAMILDGLDLQRLSPRSQRPHVGTPAKALDLESRAEKAGAKLEKGRRKNDKTRIKYGLQPIRRPPQQPDSSSVDSQDTSSAGSRTPFAGRPSMSYRPSPYARGAPPPELIAFLAGDDAAGRSLGDTNTSIATALPSRGDNVGFRMTGSSSAPSFGHRLSSPLL